MSDAELTSMSEAVRLETVTGGGRRRSWPPEARRRIVAETLTGGESVSAVAGRHGFAPQQVYGWRRQMGVERGAVSGGFGFASVVVAPATIEIEFGGMTIRVPAGCDASTLGAVLQAAKAVA